MEGLVDYSGDFPSNDPRLYSRLGEVQFMDAKLQEAELFILRDPVAFLTRFVERAIEFWHLPNSPPGF